MRVVVSVVTAHEQGLRGVCPSLHVFVSCFKPETTRGADETFSVTRERRTLYENGTARHDITRLGLFVCLFVCAGHLAINICLFQSKISRLPAYLTVQMVRFFYKEKESVNAKVLKVILICVRYITSGRLTKHPGAVG